MLFLIAAIVGAGIAVLYFWLVNRGIKPPWYALLIGIIGVLLLALAIQSFIGSGAEAESDVATKFLIYVGIPAVILIGVSALLTWNRSQRTS